MNYKPYAISWNTTYRCNLRCSHCYLDTNALTRQSACELSTQEGLRLIDQMAELNPNLLLILTGGEPLLRKDIYELASYASKKGMMVVLGTNGNLIDDDIAKKLKESGVVINYFHLEDVSKLSELLDAGVDFVLTDNLEVMISAFGRTKYANNK